MRRFISLIGVLVLGFLLVGCSVDDAAADDDFTVVTVGVVGAFQHQWDAVNANLYEDRIRVDLVHFTEWTTPNTALSDGETDLNAFQNYNFLNAAIANNDYEFDVVGRTFISPMNIFNGRANIPVDPSRESLYEYVEDGWVVGVPSDPANHGRALKLLEASGLIAIDPAAGYLPTVADITHFYREIEILPAESNNLPHLLPDLDIAVINNPQAMSNGISANDESIRREDAFGIAISENLINIIVARAGEGDNPVFQRILEAYQTPEVIEVFQTEFDGAFIAAW